MIIVGTFEVPVSSDSHGLTKSWLQVKKDAFRLIPDNKRQLQSSAVNKTDATKTERIGNVASRRNFSTSIPSCAPSGGKSRDRYNTVHVDKPLGSLKEIQDAQIAKFDAADKSIRKKSYNAPLSIRGWTSKGLGGLTVGQPESYQTVSYDGFQTKILKVKRVGTMKSKGRNYRKWVLVVIGNYNGLIGYGVGKGEFKLKLSTIFLEF